MSKKKGKFFLREGDIYNLIHEDFPEEDERDEYVKDWVFADKSNTKDDFAVIKMSDLAEYFEYRDRQWLQINRKTREICVSHEGIDYEPRFVGKLVSKEDALKICKK